MSEPFKLANGVSTVTPQDVVEAVKKFGSTPYVYDEQFIRTRARELVRAPSAFGLTARYAMKALPTKRIIQIVHDEDMHIDASSMNEVYRTIAAGVPHGCIQLTSQEVPTHAFLKEQLSKGLLYNVCSPRQLENLFASDARFSQDQLSIRIHPEKGSGGTTATTTGGEKSCFGVPLEDLQDVLTSSYVRGHTFTRIHSHVGSGGSSSKWAKNVDIQLRLIREHFPEAHSVSFGGGLKEARMPGEEAFDVSGLLEQTSNTIKAYFSETGQQLHVEIEPGTYVVANSGFLPLQVIDRKKTGKNGFDFLVCNGGMEISTRPLLYGSQHPLYVVSKNGELLSSDFDTHGTSDHVVVGHCCESGDAQTLDEQGGIITRRMVTPEIGDYIVSGSMGAYCSAMALLNYNSHVIPTEVLKNIAGQLELIRRRQTFEQMVQNEL